jgi:ribosomal protein L12E/L44/L45/RPP1/RPP2
MVIEQGGMIVEADDHEMAIEVLPFLQDTVSGIESVIADCADEPAPVAPKGEGAVPTEDGEAPTESEEAPMEEEPPPVEDGE